MKSKSILLSVYFFFFCITVFAQVPVLRGVVRMNGQPVSDLTVYTTFATVQTDALGRYAIPLTNCPECKPGHTLIISTTDLIRGSSQQNCTINSDFIFDFTIEPGKVFIHGMVQNTGPGAGWLTGIEVRIVSNRIQAPVELTNSIGEFRIPVPKVLLLESNAIQLQVRDPANRYKPLSYEPLFYNISSFNIIKMEPGSATMMEVNSFISTKVCVKKGDVIFVEASGQIHTGTFVGTSDPDGRATGLFGISLAAYNIIPAFNHAALLYRIEGEKEWRLVGKNKKIVAGKDGCLEFMVNDSNLTDNEGSYSVSISVQRG